MGWDMRKACGVCGGVVVVLVLVAGGDAAAASRARPRRFVPSSGDVALPPPTLPEAPFALGTEGTVQYLSLIHI